ncbi:MAG: uroporphyrinogen-III synthase [Opitutales bacterium]|nr:uroporphyrinogen-III synthase [Opitutales bacterium]
MKKSVLQKKTIVLTRTPADNLALREHLESDHDAKVLEVPLIEVGYSAPAEIQAEIFDLFGEYEWLVFTSVHGVEGFFKNFFKRYRDIRSIGGCRIACVGPATAAAVEAFHLEVDAVPETQTGEALAKLLVEKWGVENVKICLITGNRNRETVAKILAEDGRAIVDSFPVYETNPTDLAADQAARSFRENGAHAIVFASPSAVQSFVDQLPSLTIVSGARQPKVVAIGEVTAAALRRKMIPVAAVAKSATVSGIVEALESVF